MFYIIKDRKITDSSSSFIEGDGITYDFDFSQEPHFCPGCLIDVVDGVYTLTHNSECDKMVIDEKLQRMNSIRSEIIQLGGINQIPTDTALDSATTLRIAELTDEFNALKIDVATYEPTLIDDVLLTFFG